MVSAAEPELTDPMIASVVMRHSISSASSPHAVDQHSATNIVRRDVHLDGSLSRQHWQQWQH